MTETTNAIVIASPAGRIYELASATERWAEILPHYRFVRVLGERDGARIVEMAAWRDAIPIRWIAEQRNDATRPHIAFHHIKGWTRGMDVEWLFEPIPEGTRVRIVHRLDFAFPIAAQWLGEHVVADFFVRNVAGKTLSRMKELAER